MLKVSFDKKIRQWVDLMNSYVGLQSEHCRIHSLPQINFMVRGGKLWSNLALVADLSELWDVLEMLEIKFDNKKPLERTAKDTPKEKFFKIKMEKLSNETVLMICEYVALDYCFFDFEPPEICKSLVSNVCNGLHEPD